jgi:hypothetical protein
VLQLKVLPKKTNLPLKGNKIPTLVNGILDSNIDLPRITHTKDKILKVKIHPAKGRPMKPKHKVLIIGDSHTRKCSSVLQNNLNMDYKVSSFVKPGALMKELIKTANEEVNSLTNDDDVIVWGGVRDISRNNAKEALKSIREFVK